MKSYLTGYGLLQRFILTRNMSNFICIAVCAPVCEATLQVISLSSQREADRNYYVLDYLVIFIAPNDFTTFSIIFYVVKAPRRRYKHAISQFMCVCI